MARKTAEIGGPLKCHIVNIIGHFRALVLIMSRLDKECVYSSLTNSIIEIIMKDFEKLMSGNKPVLNTCKHYDNSSTGDYPESVVVDFSQIKPGLPNWQPRLYLGRRLKNL